MAYSHGWDEEHNQRYELRSLWFLLGVAVFAFSVLIVASIVNGSGSDRVHLSDAPARQEQTAPAQARPASRGVSPAATPQLTRPLSTNRGASS